MARVGPDGEDHDVIELVPSARSVRITTDREGLRRLAADHSGCPPRRSGSSGRSGELKAVAAHAGIPLVKGSRGGRPGPVGDRGSRGRRGRLGACRRAGPGTAQHVCWLKRWSRSSLLSPFSPVTQRWPQRPLIEFCAPSVIGDADGEVLESWQPQKMSAARWTPPSRSPRACQSLADAASSASSDDQTATRCTSSTSRRSA